MSEREETTLLRDCVAIQIPDGFRIVLPAGTSVSILQALGGSYTVSPAQGGLYRIDEENVDALGKEPPASAGAAAEAGPLEERVWDEMRKCFDPEIPVNIVELGLVYDCRVDPPADGGQEVHVKMTLTAPGCGMGEILAQDVQRRIESLPGVKGVRVEVVFDPPWNPGMMSEAARLQLGFL